MKNELFSIGPITIYGYGLMIAIGVLAAYFSATYRSKKYALDPDKVFYVTVWAVIGGVGGAKLLYLITQLPAILKDPSLLKDARNGFVVYGGIIGGILAAWLYCKVAKLKFMKYFDLVMPSVALAQGFGRIGCFLAGCCYGKETNSAFHIIFHDSAYAPNNVPLIPTQLISSGLDFLNCIFLMWFAGKKKGDGQNATWLFRQIFKNNKICRKFVDRLLDFGYNNSVVKISRIIWIGDTNEIYQPTYRRTNLKTEPVLLSYSLDRSAAGRQNNHAALSGSERKHRP